MNALLQGNIRWTKIILLASSIIICFILQLWIIASVAVYLIIRMGKISHQIDGMRCLKENLFKKDSQKKQFIIKDSLQYLKSCRMIYFGYDYRSNTNIILQLQKENHQNCVLSQEENLIYQQICKIYEQTVQIIRKIQKTLKIKQQCLPQIKVKINSFQDIFTANRLFQSLFTHQRYSIDMAEDTVNSAFKNTNFQQKVKQLVKIIPQIKIRQQSLKNLQNINRSIWKRNISQEYKQYFKFFIDKNYSEDNQNVKKWIDALSNSIKNKDAFQKFEKRQSFFSDDLNLNSQSQIIRLIPKEQSKENNIICKKAEFIKKLDTLLMIGMMRRKQQEEDKKICILDENSNQID